MLAPSLEPEKREYYRLQFPRTERPLLVIGERHYEVLDCSVRGLRCIVNEWQPPLPVGEQVEGLMQFHGRAQTPIRGLVIRIQHNEIALYLPGSEIPFSLLRKEERYLTAHYRARTL